MHGEAERMRNVEPVIEESMSVEDVHHLQLVPLLHELVREKGNRGATGQAPRPMRRSTCVRAWHSS